MRGSLVKVLVMGWLLALTGGAHGAHGPTTGGAVTTAVVSTWDELNAAAQDSVVTEIQIESSFSFSSYVTLYYHQVCAL